MLTKFEGLKITLSIKSIQLKPSNFLQITSFYRKALQSLVEFQVSHFNLK